MKQSSTSSSIAIILRHCFFGMCFFATLTLLAYSANAQISTTAGKTPLGMAPGSPAGSYALDGFEHINPYNGHLNFALPVMRIGGRGAAGYTMMLRTAPFKWQVQHVIHPVTGAESYYPSANWWTGLLPGFSPGVVIGRKAGQTVIHPSGCPIGTNFWGAALTRITFTAADGTEYELRDQQLFGQPKTWPGTSCSSQGPLRGKTFISGGGDSVTFVSDDDVYDNWGAYPQTFYPSGYLMFPDGTRYRVVEGKVSRIRDRNGNEVTFDYDTSNQLILITDSLGRHVDISYSPLVITFKGFGGATRTVQISSAFTSDTLRPCRPDPGYQCYTPQTFKQLFPTLDGSSSTIFSTLGASALTLPDGIRQYRFYYNNYGELARVDLPTGGVIEYDYASGNPNDSTGVVIGDVLGVSEKALYRRLVERRVYADGVTLQSKTTYSIGTDPTIVDQLNSVGTLLSREKHYFYGDPKASFFTTANAYPVWNEGREYKTLGFDSNGTTELRRVENNWQQGVIVSPWDTTIPNNPRLSDLTTTFVDTTQVTKKVFGYDDSVPYNNQNNVKEYDFGNGVAGALLRETRTTFVTSSTYTNVGLLGLPLQVSVYNGGGTLSASASYEYDNYTASLPHGTLTPRTSISGFDSSFDTNYLIRGNLTGTTRYLITNGVLPNCVNSPGQCVSTYAQYDIAGNVVKTIDALGFATDIDYTDRFGTPDGEARSNPGPTDLGSQSSFAFATKVTNALGHTAYTQFDYYLGKPVNFEDANGIVGSSSYDDPLDRTKLVKQAIGTLAENHTTFVYNDTARIITTASDLDAVDDGKLVSKLLYDQMGRTTETQQFEGGTNYIAVQTHYDPLGRAFKTSNPFRPWQSETAIWTTSTFDALGRVTSVTTPDSAMVNSFYSGNQVLVKDQIGKERMSRTNALGQLTDVWEITSADDSTESISFPNHPEVTAGYRTKYTYDTLGNLITVTQRKGITGTMQTRTFAYDSLSRLTDATNPESGHIVYDYDANGNLLHKTDARLVTTTYEYDALNRNKTVDYSDTVAINPDITRLYDGAANGKGRLSESYAGGSASVGNNVEHTKVTGYDAFGRPLSQLQEFKTNGVWSSAYTTQRLYNLAGAVASQNYPSGKTVAYAYDTAGRTSSFTGYLGDGAYRAYSSEILYSPLGGMTSETFGTDTALYNKTIYNSRGQAAEIRVGTYHPTDSTWWNRGAIINHYSDSCWGSCGGSNSTTQMTDNNGNLRKQDVYIPNTDVPNTQPITSFTTWWQQYNYDALNRLDWVREISNGVEIWKQDFSYDRYGNRTIDQTNTWGPAAGPAINKKNFTVDTTNNRLGVPAGQSGTMSYDNAGNLTTDTYSGAAVTRAYDAENRMTSETQANGYVAGSYGYNADGQRVRRTVGGQPSAVTTWQVYGIDGELLAEYAANAPSTTPQKEYGYRNGQLLITAEGSMRTNVALAANGSTTLASSSLTGYPASKVNDGDRKGGDPQFWADSSPGNFSSDWVEVDFSGSKTISEIDVVTLQDNLSSPIEPTLTQTFSSYGATAYDVQYWNGTAWIAVTGGNVTGNNKVWRQFAFTAVTTTKIRVVVKAVPDSYYSRIVELEAWTVSVGSTSANINWLMTDQLGTPRMIFDKTGSLATTKRHDYLPFGEEIFAGTGARSTAQGYSVADGVRQKFTQKERDNETGLDYFLARYYSSVQGRFTSVDPLSGVSKRPQSWNRYSYALNNPLKYIDPDGERWAQRKVDGGTEYLWCPDDDSYDAMTDAKSDNYQGWTAVDFDETKDFNRSTSTEDAFGNTTFTGVTLRPDGSATKSSFVLTAADRQLITASSLFGGFRLAGSAIRAEHALTSAIEETVDDLDDVIRSTVQSLFPSGLTPLHNELNKASLDYWRKKSTEEIIDSLKPGNPEAFKVTPGGTVMNGNTRVQVLLERGVDVNSLPREIHIPTP